MFGNFFELFLFVLYLDKENKEFEQLLIKIIGVFYGMINKKRYCLIWSEEEVEEEEVEWVFKKCKNEYVLEGQVVVVLCLVVVILMRSVKKLQFVCVVSCMFGLLSFVKCSGGFSFSWLNMLVCFKNCV